MDKPDVTSLSQEEKVSLPSIESHIDTYHNTFAQSLELWKARGFNREEGVSLTLRQAAYNGLRSRLSHYNTHGLQSLMGTIRWQEYEFYLYWKPAFINTIKGLIADFRHNLTRSNLDQELSIKLQKGIDRYEQELLRLATRKKGSDHERLEQQAKEISAILNAHTIQDYNFLLRTLLYYEMEYRELGRQAKHVIGVNQTLDLLRGRIQSANITPTQKEELFEALQIYDTAFSKLVQLDNDIALLMAETTQTFKRLNPLINDAVSQEDEVIAKIRQQTNESNKLHTRINLMVMIVMVLLAIFLVTLMVRRLGTKVGRIGEALAHISRGDLDLRLDSLPELKRDELDQISHNVGMVAISLKEAMGRLEKRNSDLEVISKKLAKYLSPQVYASIFSGRQEVRIQSGRKKLTIFFSDIVGFTNTTDSMESEELTNLLNDYLNEMSKIALQHGGTIDKFIGDAIMIFFGDPESRGEKEDALACVNMAIDMRNRMGALRNIWWEQQGFSQPFRIRIGITTGYCTVGNFGSEDRMDYTIIGGNVNLASRLEHHAEPDTILISHETYSLIKDKILCTPREEIKVKGITHPVTTYQVEGKVDHLSTKKLNFKSKGRGYTVQVEGGQLDPEERQNLASTLEEMARRLRN
ncbi:MAG: hypothetical protein HQL72_12005 [Magnetococcales bacterium]|nr:hypothetical protein [Magnetococcales bacterium]